MKIVALTQRIMGNEEYPETRDVLDVRWGEFFTKLNALPVGLPACCDFRNYFMALDIAGVLLTGGNDLCSVSPSPLSARRDAYEKELLRFALENSIPVLGVCRGMQIIGEYFGAKLVRVPGHTATRHRIEPAAEFGNSEAYRGRTDVNSYHRYALASLPAFLKVAARSPDSTVEGVEHVDLPVYGVMWHPERERDFQESDILLFKKVFKL